MLEFSFLPIGESRELVDDLRRVFADLATALGPDQGTLAGEYHPTLDVLETSTAVEIVVDVAGVPPEAIRVLFRGDVLVVAGAKAPAAAGAATSFHLLERGYGRFARAVRLSGAFEIGQARASLADGELAIVLPKRDDRRGQAKAIPISAGSQARA